MSKLNLKKYKIEDDDSIHDDLINESKELTQSHNIEDKKINIISNTKIITNKFDNSELLNNNEFVNNYTNYNKSNNANNVLVKEESFNKLDNKEDNIDETNNFHHIQIVDEDVENFKRRLDIMVKNFRTDTLKDFMSIKRHLLVEQKAIIDSEKQKCDAMLSSKIDQIEHLKENLSLTKSQLTKEIEIKENLTNYLFKLKSEKQQNILKKKTFINGLLSYHKKKKKNKTVKLII